jgi:hypothetical protein
MPVQPLPHSAKRSVHSPACASLWVCFEDEIVAWQAAVGGTAPQKAQADGGAARSTFRAAPTDVVKALLDCGEARFDHRLKFEVGEDIWPVLFDTFADEFTDIDGIYALSDAFPDPIDLLGKWA